MGCIPWYWLYYGLIWYLSSLSSQLLLWSGRQSLIPGICGVIAGFIYRYDVASVQEVGVWHYLYVLSKSSCSRPLLVDVPILYASVYTARQESHMCVRRAVLAWRFWSIRMENSTFLFRNFSRDGLSIESNQVFRDRVQKWWHAWGELGSCIFVHVLSSRACRFSSCDMYCQFLLPPKHAIQHGCIMYGQTLHK